MAAPQSSEGVIITKSPAIKNAPLPAEGNGSFSNIHLAALVLLTPILVSRFVPYFGLSMPLYLLLLLTTGIPVTIAYWTLMSTFGPRKNTKLAFPGKPITDYIDFKDAHLKQTYAKANAKIPMQIFYDAYFEGKVDFKGDVLDVLEYRHDWASFRFTRQLFEYVFLQMLPEVIMHSQSQDEEQVRDHYDRGDDFYEWFLGPRMVYTSGIVLDNTKEESLEQLQDNKLALVCEKLDLQPTDTLLDIGCGWGTLAAFAAKNYKCDVTGITLGKNQTKFGNERIAKNGVDSSKARILCMDYREIPAEPSQRFTKIVSLEMAEHVGIRRYGSFMRQVYDLLDDNGTFVLQVAGIRPAWQYEDLIWGLFMNRFVFPGADASCSLGWVINQVEAAGFEVKNIDVLGVHYSATIYRWYKNWLSNEKKIVAKYGDKWFRIWSYFLAYSVITSRQGGASVFQITLHKNLNAYPRINGVTNHTSLHWKPRVEITPVVCQTSIST
ncbi:uncharacterized protein L969DRAFT_96077 [Mixia osmundae IAM 14324]|uniref:sphingolipid C(9)-methyltransferase n=1 Tax=Mixia osmundae (strain CBS 9802 / IAM 14324 / JCM 22182 / KY 12970) TaxID=764103 RepID=G7DS38_MIXOS|nr:uncharacterized protein L969DRAFT_96077 [Mixia osmundae IAM 14324]KEI37547.1 hypothetical protein L969DRAFT_96077 [Mixia osmundae IAM 14324]GAA93398.1 hypothetical protein E5Q_00039 [Mixia osmundae IAM 14324]